MGQTIPIISREITVSSQSPQLIIITRLSGELLFQIVPQQYQLVLDIRADLKYYHDNELLAS